jgi:hypothetical protein
LPVAASDTTTVDLGVAMLVGLALIGLAATRGRQAWRASGEAEAAQDGANRFLRSDGSEQGL